jgi:DNA invertase Pin-like site-specific DNA recombinase
MQRDAIARASQARGDAIDEWFEETASSVQQRPELARLRELARGGRVRKIYVYRLDRLSRSGILEILNIVHELRNHGCALETVADGFSLDSPATDVILSVFAWVAQMERTAIRERLDAARRAIEARGGHWGRPRKFGEPTIERMEALKVQGCSVRKIAVVMKIPKTTVARALSRNYAPKLAPIGRQKRA